MQKTLPTPFAKKIALSVDLLLEEQNATNFVAYNEKMEDLREFQKQALVSSFDKAVMVFYGTELTDEQRKALKVVHETTKSFVLGDVMDVCVDKIKSHGVLGKDFSEALTAVLEQLTKTGDGETAGKLKGLFVKFTE